jgi:hypothetical protein
MKTRYSIDQASFQIFLDNAIAVQESGLDPQSLSALIEIQRFVTSDEFELDRAMHMIAERALVVSHASGVAIAFLEANKNELVYKAGSGRATNDVGRRVPAVLSASSPQEHRREILRVENAGTDKRIEAEICRQFGAMGLLMVPIYKAHALVGVLQVLFDEAHSFVEREVRTYRLMVSALEDGISRDLETAQKDPAASTVEQMPKIRVAADPCLPPAANVAGASQVCAVAEKAEADTQSIAAAALSTGAGTSAEPEEKALHDHVAIIVRELRVMWRAFTRAMATFQARAWSAHSRYAGPAVAGVLVVTIVIMVSHLNHSSDANISSSISTAHDAQQAPASPLFVNDEKKLAGDEHKEIRSPGGGFKRVRVGPNEVDYVSEDVTIKHFETRPAKAQIRKGVGKEIIFGDDVTVRYFGNMPAFASQKPSDSETKPTTNQSSFQSQ